jgi:WD40 repeat protein
MLILKRPILEITWIVTVMLVLLLMPQGISHSQGVVDGVSTVAWSPDGKVLATGRGDGTVSLLDVATNNTAIFHDTLHHINSLAWKPDSSQLAVGYSFGFIQIVNIHAGQVTGVYVDITVGDEVRSVAWSPDGGRLASTSLEGLGPTARKSIKVWDTITHQLIADLSGAQAEPLSSIAWSPDGSKIVSGSDDSTIVIWDVATVSPISTLIGHAGFIYTVKWSPDGTKLASASTDGTGRIWDASTGQTLLTLYGQPSYYIDVDWSPDGQAIVVANNRTVTIFNSITGQVINTAEEKNKVNAIAWNPNGSRIAIGSDSGTYQVNSVTLLSIPTSINAFTPTHPLPATGTTKSVAKQQK